MNDKLLSPAELIIFVAGEFSVRNTAGVSLSLCQQLCRHPSIQNKRGLEIVPPLSLDKFGERQKEK
jgi:hypothetical protein